MNEQQDIDPHDAHYLEQMAEKDRHAEVVSAARELAFLVFVLLRSDELGAKNVLDGEGSIGTQGDELVIPTRMALRRLSDRVSDLVGPEPFECPKCGSTEHHPIATCAAARSGEGE